jgi:hypothetical protein
VKRDLSNSTNYHFLYINPTDKGREYLHNLHIQRIFDEFYKFTDLYENLNRFLKKNCGLDLIWPGRTAMGQPRSSERGHGTAALEPASRPEWSAGEERRTGTRRAWPSDLVRIDGHRSSTPQKKG